MAKSGEHLHETHRTVLRIVLHWSDCVLGHFRLMNLNLFIVYCLLSEENSSLAAWNCFFANYHNYGIKQSKADPLLLTLTSLWYPTIYLCRAIHDSLIYHITTSQALYGPGFRPYANSTSAHLISYKETKKNSTKGS